MVRLFCFFEVVDRRCLFLFSLLCKVISLRIAAKLGEKADVFIPCQKLNWLSSALERLTDDIIREGEVYEATLSFRPRGCFLEEVSLHNHEKAYKTVKATKLGEKTIIHLVGAQTGEKLSYLVPSSDLIYSSLMVYMRKKAKK